MDTDSTITVVNAVPTALPIAGLLAFVMTSFIAILTETLADRHPILCLCDSPTIPPAQLLPANQPT